MNAFMHVIMNVFLCIFFFRYSIERILCLVFGVSFIAFILYNFMCIKISSHTQYEDLKLRHRFSQMPSDIHELLCKTAENPPN